MSELQLTCNKCYKITGTLYSCCKKEQQLCCSCARGQICHCGKKINKPYTISKIGTSSSIKKQQTCKNCRQRLQKVSNCIKFDCTHVCCFKCVSKKIQESIKSGSWQRNYLKNPKKQQVQCNCQQGGVFDISNWIQEYCFCCAKDFGSNQKVKLRYGLEIMQKCRNKLLQSDSSWSIMTSQEINRLSKECNSCLKLIDGYRKKVGLEDSFGCECNQCLDPKTSVTKKCFQNETRGQCAACGFKHNTKDMIMAENFYLCQDCYSFSLKRSKIHQKKLSQKSQKTLKQSQQIQKLQVQPKNVRSKQINCVICEKKIKNPEDYEIKCQQCILQFQDLQLVEQQLQKSLKRYSDSNKKSKLQKEKPIQQIRSKIFAEKDAIKKENSYKMLINHQDELVPDIKRNLSTPDYTKHHKCASCDRNFQYVILKHIDEFQANLCSQCIEENERLMFGLRSNRSQSVSNARIRTRAREYTYTSVDEHKKWRKNISFKQFLSESDEPTAINQTQDKIITKLQMQTNMTNAYSANFVRQTKINQRVMESIIQEFPDIDHLSVAVLTQNIMNCSICRCILAKKNQLCYTTKQYKVLNLCMYCCILCEAKKI